MYSDSCGGYQCKNNGTCQDLNGVCTCYAGLVLDDNNNCVREFISFFQVEVMLKTVQKNHLDISFSSQVSWIYTKGKL